MVARLKWVGCWEEQLGFGFHWYAGDPSFWKNLIPHGESVGETDLLYGTHIKGLRCQKCRKIVLDY